VSERSIATATTAAVALQVTAAPSATTVVAAPQLLPTAGPGGEMSEGGIDAGYFVFFLIVFVLAGIIIVLNMRRKL
jgi:hypothetical protein